MQLLRYAPLLTLLFPVIAAADPPPCERWQNRLSKCNALGKTDPCTIIGSANEKAESKIYASSAWSACQKYLSVVRPEVGDNFVVWPVDATPEDEDADGDYDQARCVWDDPDEEGTQITWNDWLTGGGVMVDYNTNLTAAPHCFCTVTNPPYGKVPFSESELNPRELWRMIATHSFPTKLKRKILEANWNGRTYTSDADHDPLQVLQKDDIHAADAAEIDHIIPRVDSKGCLCGPPTPDNAAVISRHMNGGMSNTSPKWNLNRAKMYEQFGVVCTDPNAGKIAPFLNPDMQHELPFDLFDVGESVGDVTTEMELSARSAPAPVIEDKTTGGCSAGGSAFLGIGLALLGLRRRRR